MIERLLSPRMVVTALLLVILATLPLLTQAFDQRYLLSVGTRIVIWSIAAVSLNMILGYGGLVSFGHAAFFGIGGYAVGILSAEGIQSGWIQWPIALAASIMDRSGDSTAAFTFLTTPPIASRAAAICSFTRLQTLGFFGCGAGRDVAPASKARRSGLVRSSTTTSFTAWRAPSRHASATAWLSPSARVSMIPSRRSS